MYIQSIKHTNTTFNNNNNKHDHNTKYIYQFQNIKRLITILNTLITNQKISTQKIIKIKFKKQNN